MKKEKGFTLIELLIVIAIIGILAGVIMAMTSSSRDKAYNSKVESQLKGALNQAELYAGPRAGFSQNTCAVTAGTLFDTANNGLGGLFKGLTLTGSRCVDNGSSWAIAIPLRTTGFWCVDSTGASRSKNNNGTSYDNLNSAITDGSGVTCNQIPPLSAS